MELIKCPECKNSISNAFYTCVYCEYSRNKNTGTYHEYLPCVHSASLINDGNCMLIVTKSNWKVIYNFREYQKHNRTEVEIDGSGIDEYLCALKDCYAKYEKWEQLSLTELFKVNDLSEYFECSAKDYPIRLNRSSIAYSETASILNIFGKTNLEIHIDKRYSSSSGVMLGGHHELRVDSKSKLNNIVSNLIYAHERAMVVMPVMKML